MPTPQGTSNKTPSKKIIVEIYEVHFLSKSIPLLTPQDVNMFIDCFCRDIPQSLIDNMRVIPLSVEYGSEKYNQAVNNSHIMGF